MNSNLERGVVWGCPPDGGFSLRVGRQSDNTLGGIDPSIPYVTTPRRTFISNSQPIIRWNPVAGASRYTVQVLGDDVNWETEVSGTQVQYPGTPALTPGVEYRVIVEADNGASSQLDVGAETATFERLYPEDLEIVETDIAQIREQEFPEETEALSIADIYIREDLLAAAIDTLEPFVASGTETLEVYQVLGDIYRYVGLNLLAEERYERSIEIATAIEDIQGLADARSGLAEVKAMLDQPEAAIKLLTQAQSGYETLNDTERIEELQKRIDDLT
ncbi:MAG: tetratricopeptide repeat protein [Limnospira sp.]